MRTKNKMNTASSLKNIITNTLFALMIFAAWTGRAQTENNFNMCITNDFETISIPNALVLSGDTSWPVGSKLTVAFLDTPSALVRSKIKQYAQEWEKYANIDFEFVNGKVADIRIGLEKGGSWSKIGTLAQHVDAAKKTMNFGWFDDDTKDASFKSTTMHEFGHALGLKHEHQSPAAGICWDWDKVIPYFKDSDDWDEARTRGNLEQLSNSDVGNYTAHDPKSIMHYTIPNEVTSCNFSTNTNRVLSTLDKQGIANIYPKGNSRSIINKHLKDYKWTSGWDNVETFETGGKTFLFLLKSKTGDVHVHQLNSNGTVGTKVFDKKWTSGWTSAAVFKMNTQAFLFLLKEKTGEVKVFKINASGTVGAKVFDKKWSTGWTNAKIYKQGLNSFLFLLKQGTGDVHTHKLNPNGTVGTKIFDKKWTPGWSTAEIFYVNNRAHLFLMKSGTGDIHINRLNSLGTVSTKVYDEKLATRWTSASFYQTNNQQHLMLSNSLNGQVTQWYITAGATIGDKIYDKRWTKGWSTLDFYGIGNKNFMFLLKDKDGAVKTYSLINR